MVRALFAGVAGLLLPFLLTVLAVQWLTAPPAGDGPGDRQERAASTP
jgi:hypothetical protein